MSDVQVSIRISGGRGCCSSLHSSHTRSLLVIVTVLVLVVVVVVVVAAVVVDNVISRLQAFLAARHVVICRMARWWMVL